MIYLSMDVDWAPDWAIRQAVDSVIERGLALTVFVTHDSPVMRDLATDPRVERALHPNYMAGSSHGATRDAVLDHMAEVCPEGRGVRAHGLERSTSHVIDYGSRGVTYEASDLLFLQPGLTGGRYWNGMAQLPTWWEDDVHMLHGLPMVVAEIPLAAAPPLAIFDFHPILLALNSADLSGYVALKAALRAAGRSLSEASEAEVARYADQGAGNRTLLTALCDWCLERADHGRHTLSHAAREVR